MLLCLLVDWSRLDRGVWPFSEAERLVLAMRCSNAPYSRREIDLWAIEVDPGVRVTVGGFSLEGVDGGMGSREAPTASGGIRGFESRSIVSRDGVAGIGGTGKSDFSEVGLWGDFNGMAEE